jgi:hypothetical protein
MRQHASSIRGVVGIEEASQRQRGVDERRGQQQCEQRSAERAPHPAVRLHRDLTHEHPRPDLQRRRGLLQSPAVRLETSCLDAIANGCQDRCDRAVGPAESPFIRRGGGVAAHGRELAAA